MLQTLLQRNRFRPLQQALQVAFAGCSRGCTTYQRQQQGVHVEKRGERNQLGWQPTSGLLEHGTWNMVRFSRSGPLDREMRGDQLVSGSTCHRPEPKMSQSRARFPYPKKVDPSKACHLSVRAVTGSSTRTEKSPAATALTFYRYEHHYESQRVSQCGVFANLRGQVCGAISPLSAGI